MWVVGLFDSCNANAWAGAKEYLVKGGLIRIAGSQDSCNGRTGRGADDKECGVEDGELSLLVCGG